MSNRGRAKESRQGRVSSGWATVTAANPCPICGKPDWCRVTLDGEVAQCRRLGSHSTYTPFTVGPDKGGVFRAFFDLCPSPLAGPRPFVAPETPTPATRRTNGHKRSLSVDLYERLFTEQVANDLAKELKLPTWAVSIPGVGATPVEFERGSWRTGLGDFDWTFAEQDGAGRVVGFHIRYPDGTKRHKTGTNRGLFVPDSWAQNRGPVYLVEGASDTLAMNAAGLSAIGRPSNKGGVSKEMLGALFAGLPAERDIIVVGENDRKDDGTWPGREGAYITATRLAALLERSVKWAMVPKTAKDVRDWLTARAAPSDTSRHWRAVGEELAEALASDAISAEPGWPLLPRVEVKVWRCPKEVWPIGLVGKPGKKKAGMNAAANLPCDCWKCEACRSRNSNLRLAWFYCCVLQCADPERMHESVERSEFGSVCSAGNPWSLYAGNLTTQSWNTTRKNLDKQNKTTRQVEYVTVADSHGGAFVLIAIAPELTAPRKLTKMSSDSALSALQRAFAEMPEPSGERFRPVNNSRGWMMPKAFKEPLYNRGRKYGYSTETIRGLIRSLGGAPGDSPVSRKVAPDGATWSEHGIGGPLVSFMVRELLCPDSTGGKLTEEDLTLRAAAWKEFILANQIPDCSGVRHEIRSRIGHDPTADDIDPIFDAFARDGVPFDGILPGTDGDRPGANSQGTL